MNKFHPRSSITICYTNVTSVCYPLISRMCHLFDLHEISPLKFCVYFLVPLSRHSWLPLLFLKHGLYILIILIFVRPLWTGDQPDIKPQCTQLAEHKKTRTNIHALSEIQTRDHSIQAALDREERGLLICVI